MARSLLASLVLALVGCGGLGGGKSGALLCSDPITCSEGENRTWKSCCYEGGDCEYQLSDGRVLDCGDNCDEGEPSPASQVSSWCFGF